MKVGISTYAWYHLPLDQMLEMIAESGYDAVSLGSRKEHSSYHLAEGRKQLYHQLNRLHLELDSVHAPAGIRNDKLIDISSPVETERQHAIFETYHAIHAAADCGAPYVVIHPIGTKWRTEFDLLSRADAALFSLQSLQEYALKLGVTLALENLDPPENVMFDAVCQRALELGLVYCFDNGHAFVGHKHKEYWDLMFPYIKTLHLHDNDGTSDTHDAPGTGNFPWSEWNDWLFESSYDGILGLECRFRGEDANEFRNWLIENLRFIKTQVGSPRRTI